jgi:hypothetical protein
VPVTIQLGDIANRLRRAFDIRGRIPTALDETIVPTTLVRDAGVLPFALDPSEAAGSIEQAAVVGVQSTLAISNQGPKGSVFLLDELWLSNSVAGGRVEVSKSGVLATDGTISDTNDLADMSTNCFGLLTGQTAPVRLTAWSVAPAATGGAIAHILRVLTTDQCYRVRAMLRRGEVVYVKNLSTNQDLRLSCAGRFYTAAAFDQ